ncbi:MAG: hypothetical protein ACLP7Q_10550 [Isosphaeraceae bacterium]
MLLGLFARSVGHNTSLAHAVTSPAAQASVASFLVNDAVSTIPAVWTDVYKLAYEKACLALAPSRFQMMLEPGMN